MKKQLSPHAMAAKQIRTKLKAKFPETKFSVTSESYSMGNSVDINWTNGPTTSQVDEIGKEHQYGHFDGMIDMYENSNRRDDIAQVKYVMTQRSISDEMNLKAAQVIANHYTALEEQKVPVTVEDLAKDMMVFDQWYNWYQLNYRVLQRLDLTNAIGIKEDSSFESGCMFDGFEALVGEAQ